MKIKILVFIQCIILWICSPITLFSQQIPTGSWSTTSGDVSFYISQDAQLDTLRIRLTFSSGSCSGSIGMSSYGVSIVDRSFSRDLGSSWDGSTGSITGNFSDDGASCSGNYNYTQSPCDPINVSWTATVIGAYSTDIGIEETHISELTIFPNPTSSLLTIESEHSGHYLIEITTLNGQQKLIGEMEGNSHKIDLSSFQKGAYFITIWSKDFVATRKIIKL